MSDGEELVHRVLRLWHQYDLAHDDLLWVAPLGEEASFAIDCSDLFAWGEADSEPITNDNIEQLEQLLRDSPPGGPRQLEWSLRLWCLMQRDQPPMALRLRGAPTWFRQQVEHLWPLS